MAATQDFHRKTQEEISMTREEFQKLTQDVVLLDGATGSNLMAAGMPRNLYRSMDHGAQRSSAESAKGLC